MNEIDQEALKRSRAKLLLLISIAFVPLFIAYAAYFYFPEVAPEGSTNNGELITPPLSGADISDVLAAPGKWTLVQAVGSSCDADCEQLLYLSRQVVIGLGKDSGRMQRVMLHNGELPAVLQDWLAREHGDLVVAGGDTTLLTSKTSDQPLLFLVDPLGNVMMRYSAETAGKPMLKDLKHLLRISNIG